MNKAFKNLKNTWKNMRKKLRETLRKFEGMVKKVEKNEVFKAFKGDKTTVSRSGKDLCNMH